MLSYSILTTKRPDVQNDLILIFMKPKEIRGKWYEKVGVVPTKFLILQLFSALEYHTWYQICARI